MRRVIFLLVAALAGVFGTGAQAQLTVEARMKRDVFLLYEPLPVQVTIRNISGRPIQLEESEGRHWLDFTIAYEDGREVLSLAGLKPEGAIAVRPNQTITRTVDLLPLYDLRTRGDYRVQAAVNNGGMRMLSAPLRFNIIQGRETWVQTVGLPATEDQPAEYRTFSLQTRRDGQSDHLYICVRDDKKGIVYGLLEMGPYIPLGDPSVRFDKAACLHLLYQSGPRAFGYICVDSSAHVLDRAGYSDYSSKPELISDLSGTVTVRGGEKVFPRSERMLTTEELNPPPPSAPPPKPKKKWWWPFGPS
jgi:hypothetical protein